MKPTYRIKDWDRFFETTESRRVVNARWVPIPNKQDGKGYRRVAQHKNGTAIFCAWTLMLQVASKTPVRGVLADHDGPLDAEDLAMKTGFPAKIFEQALEFLIDARVGWMTTDPLEIPETAEHAGAPADRAGMSADSLQGPQIARPKGKGIEGNGITEQKEEEARAERSPVVVVFDFWKERIGNERAQLTPERQQKISERLADSTVEEIKTAINGCRASDFHMGRLPNQPKKNNSIELICRDRGKLEYFIEMAPTSNGHSKPPPPKESETERLKRENCSRCYGTGTEVIPGKGGQRCDHRIPTILGSSEGNGIDRASPDRGACVP